MMAPFTHSPGHAVQASQFSDPPTSSQENAENGAQRKKNLSGVDGSEEEDADLAFAKSLFFKNKSGKRKGPSTSTPNPKSRAVESAKKNPRKKTKGGAGAEEQSAVPSFLERAQEKDEAFMERMAEAERVKRQQQQKFSMDALAMLRNILKDVTKGKE